MGNPSDTARKLETKTNFPLCVSPLCKPAGFISSCKQEEELKKMREVCEKNQELLQEIDILKQVEICMDTRDARACWQLG